MCSTQQEIFQYTEVASLFKCVAAVWHATYSFLSWTITCYCGIYQAHSLPFTLPFKYIKVKYV